MPTSSLDPSSAKNAAQQLLLDELQLVQQQRDMLLQQNAFLRHQHALLELTNSLSLQLSVLTEAQQIFDFVTLKITEGLGFEDCIIFKVDGTGALQRVSAAGVRHVAGDSTLMSLAPEQGIIGICAQTAKTQLINDTRLNPHYLSDNMVALSELAVPVLDGERVLAVIDCEDANAGFFTAEHQDILQHVAAILAVRMRKLEDLQQLEQTIAKLEYAELVQKALFNIASLSYDAQQFSTFYQRIHQIVSSLIYAQNFYIALYDDQEEALRFPYFVDTTEHISPHEVYPKEILQNSLTGYVFRTDEPLLIHGVNMADFDREHGVTTYGTPPESWLGVPFKSGDVVSGVVVVQSYDPEFAYGQSDLELLVFVSQHISSALERVFVQQRLVHQALHDALTNLPNRILFMDRVSHAFKRRKRTPDRIVAIMYLDLDRFKIVNDTLGHTVGDEFLIEVARLLKTCVRQNDTLARLGGDEFAILLEDVNSLEDAIEVAERIGETLQRPVQLAHHRLQTSTSIGIALATFAEPDLDQAELIRRADIAMYQAKQDGRGIWRQFSMAMDQATTQHYLLELEIELALAKEQFVLHYQPLIDLRTDETLGFEALIRWQHPERGLIAPAEFIPMAEDLALLQHIDLYVVKAAVEQALLWREQRSRDFYISVNISGRSFCDADFVPQVLAILELQQLPASFLAIEITERALIDNIEQAKANINSLREAGIAMFLDDFGTGYSSLSYLHEFKLDVLKIDRSFIAGIRPRLQENPVVNTIIALAKTLQLKVIAEGIETSLQRRLLAELGCDAGQGYWLSRPLTAKDAIEWLL